MMFFALGFGLAAAFALSSKAFAEEQPQQEKKDEEPIDWGNIFIAHYYNRVKLFQEENALLSKGKSHIVFVGDSITEGFPLKEYFPDLPVLNRGIGADGIGIDTNRGILNRMNESVFDCTASMVFLKIGVNDLPDPAKTPERCIEGYRKIVEEIEKKSPKTKIVLQTLMPVGLAYANHAFLNPRILEFNKMVRALAEEKGLTLLDMHAIYRDHQGLLPAEVSEDGLHLKPEAYETWAGEVSRIIEETK